MTRVKLDSLLQLVKALRKVGKLDGVPYNFGKGSATKGKGKCTSDPVFKPSVVNSESLVDTVIGVGESGSPVLV